MLGVMLQHVSSGVSAFAVSMEEAAKPFVVQCVKMLRLKEVSHEMRVLKLQHVESGVCAFAVSMGEAAKRLVVQCVNA